MLRLVKDFANMLTTLAIALVVLLLLIALVAVKG